MTHMIRPIFYAQYNMDHIIWSMKTFPESKINNAQKALITNRGCDTNSIIVIICVALFFSGFAYAGFLNPNILDLAPNHAGTLFGITNTFANMAGIIAPKVAGYVIQGNEYNIQRLKNVWISSTIVLCFGGMFYAVTASAEKQPWAAKRIQIKKQLSFEMDQLLFR